MNEQNVEVSVGQQWRLKDISPWPNVNPPITIVDVRDGWVRYDMSYFKDNRAKVADFLALYEFIPVMVPA